MTTPAIELTPDRGYGLTLPPDLRMRAKRVFPRMNQHVSGTLWLSDTPEHARELLWFLERFPIPLTDAVRTHMQAQAARHIEREARIAALLAGHHAPLADLPLAIPLRTYQAEVPTALGLSAGLLLADDLGLGKTASAIGCLMLQGALPALVVAPPHLLPQWRHELKRFAPHLRVHAVTKGTPYPLQGLDDSLPRRRGRGHDPSAPPPNVLLISYHMLRGWAAELAGQIKLVIAEECQQLRNPGTQIYSAFSHVAARATYRLGLSATPIHNYGTEAFYVLTPLASADALGTLDEFKREWCTTSAGNGLAITDPAALGAYLRRQGLMLRRTRADVGRELPPVIQSIQYIDADPHALRTIQGDAVRLAEVILSSQERFRGERMQAAGEFDMLMRQATGIAKAPHVAAYVRMLVESGEPVVLFGWHRQVYEIWREQLGDLNPVWYTGSESPKQKDAARNAFVSGESKLLIVSLRSGAGLDGLQSVSHIAVFGELDWSPAVIKQCIGRVDRDGQTESVLAYFLLSDAEDSMDPYMADVLGLKHTQLEGLLNAEVQPFERVDTNHAALRAIATRFLERAARGTSRNAA